MKRLTKAQRRADVEKLLGPELSEKYIIAIEYGLRMRLTPVSIVAAVRRSETREKNRETQEGSKRW